MGYQRTLILLKPDAVRRRLAGKIISRFEDAGYEILAMRIVNPASAQLVSDHYRSTDEWLNGVGQKTLKSFSDKGLDIMAGFGTRDPLEIGRIVKERLVRYMISAPIVAMVLGGNHAIRKARDMAGYTIPTEAAPGTIRGDFSMDSPDFATGDNRAVENLVHASGNQEEAEYEIGLWFGSIP